MKIPSVSEAMKKNMLSYIATKYENGINSVEGNLSILKKTIYAL